MNDIAVLDKVLLVNGEFSPSEAADIMKSLIEVKINFHKLHRLSVCEGDMTSDTGFDDSRIGQLTRELADFRALAIEAKAAGKQMRIKGILDVELID